MPKNWKIPGSKSTSGCCWWCFNGCVLGPWGSAYPIENCCHSTNLGLGTVTNIISIHISRFLHAIQSWSFSVFYLGSCDSPLTPPKASRALASRRSWILRQAHGVAIELQNDCLEKKTVIDLVKHGNVGYSCELQGVPWHLHYTWGHRLLMCMLTLIQMRPMCSFNYMACMDW